MARVFISHSSRDNQEAEALFAWLKSQGFEQGFLDIDKHAGIPAGARWEQTGGLPIRIGDDLVGGIGVGGAPSGNIDATCARAGLDAIDAK